MFGSQNIVHADNLRTAHEFLTWDREQQDYFFRISIMMSVVIAAQIELKIGNCIVDWYSNDPTTVTKRNNEILNLVKHFPEHRPSSVILAVLKKKCGKFAK